MTSPSADVCPSEERLASVLEGSITDEDREAVERHADTCARCAETLVLLARAYLDPTIGQTVPDDDAPRERSAPPQSRSDVRYRLGSRLGEGGMGVVYSAYDRVLRRDVALKLMRVDTMAPSEHRGRLLREGRAMARVSDPHVVTVFDVGEDDAGVFIVMELVRGETLRAHLIPPRTFDEIRARFVEAARGLAAAHAAGVVHRDFKPENVLVGADGRARVTDFGIARPLTPETAPASARWAGLATVGMAGTPAYMAPEQLAGEHVDAAADQFALAVCLYEAVYGERPFRQATTADRLLAMKMGLQEPKSKRTDIPAWFWPVVSRALHVAPPARFGSMKELADALATGEAGGADGALTLHVVALVGLSLVHAVLVALAVAVMNTDESGSDEPTETWVAVLLVWFAWLILCGWAPLGPFAAPTLAWGIAKRRRWAYPLAYVYATMALTTLIGTPYAIYAFVTLRRPDVRAAFGRMK